MASKKLARQGSNILQHCWLSCFLSAGDNCCHDPPPSLFFGVFLRKPITVAELLTIGTTTTRLLFVFLCFFYQKCSIAVVEPRTTPLSILFFCVYC